VLLVFCLLHFIIISFSFACVFPINAFILFAISCCCLVCYILFVCLLACLLVCFNVFTYFYLYSPYIFLILLFASYFSCVFLLFILFVLFFIIFLNLLLISLLLLPGPRRSRPLSRRATASARRRSGRSGCTWASWRRGDRNRKANKQTIKI